MADKKITCLGGGIGTVNLIKGLKFYTEEITVVSSMADDGGSSGRLRKEFGIFPPGDLTSCMAAIGNKSNPYISDLLMYRFPGNRYGTSLRLEGQKLGNLMLTALFNQGHDFETSIKMLQESLGIRGKFLPATIDQVEILIKMKDGRVIKGEEKIDLGKYKGDKDISEVFLTPKDARVNPRVIEDMENSDAIIVGPGDLYSNNFPILIVGGVAQALKDTKAKKILVINIANKPHETEDYSVSDYFNAFEKHIQGFPFDLVILNNNYSVEIPEIYNNYKYVKDFGDPTQKGFKLIKEDLLDENFPLYHDSGKLAKVIFENI